MPLGLQRVGAGADAAALSVADVADHRKRWVVGRRIHRLTLCIHIGMVPTNSLPEGQFS
jgi:hypothetical protein